MTLTKDTISVVLDFLETKDRVKMRAVSKNFNKAFLETMDRHLAAEVPREAKLQEEMKVFPKAPPSLKKLEEKILNEDTLR